MTMRHDHDTRGKVLLAFVVRNDSANRAGLAAPQLRGCPGLPQPCTSARGCVKEQRIELFPPQRPPPMSGCGRRFGHRCVEYRFSRKKPNPPDIWPGPLAKSITDAELVQQGQSGGGDEFAAHLAPRKLLLFHNRGRPPGSCQQQSGRCAGRTAADDQGVVDHGACPSRRAVKQWVKGQAGRSCNVQPGSLGQSSESSCPLKPAWTLTNAS